MARIEVELPEPAKTILEKWARMNGLTLEQHITELLKQDVILTLDAVDKQERDEMLGLSEVSVWLSLRPSDASNPS